MKINIRLIEGTTEIAHAIIKFDSGRKITISADDYKELEKRITSEKKMGENKGKEKIENKTIPAFNAVLDWFLKYVSNTKVPMLDKIATDFPLTLLVNTMRHITTPTTEYHDILTASLERIGIQTKEKEDLKFICPSCNNNTIEERIDNAVGSEEVTRIPIDGDFDYGKILLEESDTVRWQCSNCGFVITNRKGNPIIDTLEVAEWIKENCSQE